MFESRFSPTKRKISFSLKKPANDLHNTEENSECCIQDYRLLAYCLSQNINQHYAKKHKFALGELEECYKIPLSREERITLEENLEGIIDRSIMKLVRSALTRNSLISKSIDEYSEQHQKLNKTLFREKIENVNTESAEIKYKGIDYPQKETTHQRPYSSVKYSEKNLPEKSLKITNQRFLIRNRTYSMDNKISAVVSCQNNEQPIYDCEKKNNFASKLASYEKEKNIKTKELSRMRGNAKTEVIKNNPILGSAESSVAAPGETAPKINLLKEQKEGEFESNFGFDLKAISNSPNFNKLFSIELINTMQEKTAGEMRKEKMQSKILSISTNILAEIPKSQGYKAKSRCWFTPSKMCHQNQKEKINIKSIIMQTNQIEKNVKSLSPEIRYKF